MSSDPYTSIIDGMIRSRRNSHTRTASSTNKPERLLDASEVKQRIENLLIQGVSGLSRPVAFSVQQNAKSNLKRAQGRSSLVQPNAKSSLNRTSAISLSLQRSVAKQGANIIRPKRVPGQPVDSVVNQIDKSSPKHVRGGSLDSSIGKQSAKSSPKGASGRWSSDTSIVKQSAKSGPKNTSGRWSDASNVKQSVKSSPKHGSGRWSDASLPKQSARSNLKGTPRLSLDASLPKQSAKSSPKRAPAESSDAQQRPNQITPAADTFQKDLRIFETESSDQRILKENGIDLDLLCRKTTEELSKRSKKGEITASAEIDVEGTLLMEFSKRDDIRDYNNISSLIDLGLGLADSRGSSLLNNLGKSTHEKEVMVAQKAKRMAILLQLSHILYDEAMPLLTDIIDVFGYTI